MSKLYILVGIPGCGKSTYADDHLPHAKVVSSDEIRERFGDVNDQSKNGHVFQIFHAEIAWNLAHGEDVVADSTALDQRARNRLVDLAHIFDAERHLIVFTNCDQAAKRNKQRKRVVPDEVMMRMLDKYERFRQNLPEEKIMYDTVIEIGSLG